MPNKEATPVQMALALIHAQRSWIVLIPGTTKIYRLAENAAELNEDDLGQIETAVAKMEMKYKKNEIRIFKPKLTDKLYE